MQGVYAIKNKVDGKVYVGSTSDTDVRFNAHRYLLSKGEHHNAKLLESYRASGADNFEYLILEKVDDRAKLKARENHWISECGSRDETKGFNTLKAVAPPKVKPETPLRGGGSNYPMANLIRQAFEKCGHSQKELANLTGIDQSVICRYLKGDRDVQGATFVRLLEALGAEISFPA